MNLWKPMEDIPGKIGVNNTSIRTNPFEIIRALPKFGITPLDQRTKQVKNVKRRAKEKPINGAIIPNNS